jgi:hypothetical protein
MQLPPVESEVRARNVRASLVEARMHCGAGRQACWRKESPSLIRQRPPGRFGMRPVLVALVCGFVFATSGMHAVSVRATLLVCASSFRLFDGCDSVRRCSPLARCPCARPCAATVSIAAPSPPTDAQIHVTGPLTFTLSWVRLSAAFSCRPCCLPACRRQDP